MAQPYFYVYYVSHPTPRYYVSIPGQAQAVTNFAPPNVPNGSSLSRLRIRGRSRESRHLFHTRTTPSRQQVSLSRVPISSSQQPGDQSSAADTPSQSTPTPRHSSNGGLSTGSVLSSPPSYTTRRSTALLGRFRSPPSISAEAPPPGYQVADPFDTRWKRFKFRAQKHLNAAWQGTKVILVFVLRSSGRLLRCFCFLCCSPFMLPHILY